MLAILAQIWLCLIKLFALLTRQLPLLTILSYPLKRKDTAREFSNDKAIWSVYLEN